MIPIQVYIRLDYKIKDNRVEKEWSIVLFYSIISIKLLGYKADIPHIWKNYFGLIVL